MALREEVVESVKAGWGDTVVMAYGRIYHNPPVRPEGRTDILINRAVDATLRRLIAEGMIESQDVYGDQPEEGDRFNAH